MEEVVLDTSVIAKWFLQEKNSSQANKYLQQYRKRELDIYTPQIVIPELGNALYFGGDFNNQKLKESIQAFFSLHLAVVPISQDLVKKATDLVTQFEITYYDSLFISLAKIMDVFLITADQKHHRKEIYSKIKYLSDES